MAQTVKIKRFIVQAVAECDKCQGRGTLDARPVDMLHFTPDFGNEGQVVYRCIGCRGTGELKISVDLADALKSIRDEEETSS